jgi:AcrR family transcriptional regulator
MGRASLSQEAIVGFRRKVSGAAMKLFAEQGYEAVTMRALGTALGVSPMTPYRYLEGKDELFDLVRAEAFRQFADALERALARRGTPTERLEHLKKAYVKFAVAEPDAYRVMFELKQPDRPASPELAAESKRAFACLNRTVAEAVEAGELEGDPLTLAHLLWANTHGLVTLHLAGKLIMGCSLAKLAAISHELPTARRKR